MELNEVTQSSEVTKSCEVMESSEVTELCGVTKSIEVTNSCEITESCEVTELPTNVKWSDWSYYQDLLSKTSNYLKEKIPDRIVESVQRSDSSGSEVQPDDDLRARSIATLKSSALYIKNNAGTNSV